MYQSVTYRIEENAQLTKDSGAMKQLIVFVTLTVASVLAQESCIPGVTCAPSNCIVDARCPTVNQPLALLVPHTSCNKYYACNGGRACEMDCPAGLHFNSVLSICDWPHQACCDPTVQCRPDPCFPGATCPPNGPAPGPPAPAPPAPAPPAPSPPADDGCTACPLNCVPNTSCPSFNPPKPVFLAHPDCARYYVCETGRACEMVCPVGLHFNNREWVCDYPHRACCDPTIECVPESCIPGVTCPPAVA
uniref:Chitin-binding type-2 domain-containing protein n=1 Tax=Anopheles atroparvus TaxID=41427 RepID=A0AAG5D3W5_ANOAO